VNHLGTEPNVATSSSGFSVEQEGITDGHVKHLEHHFPVPLERVAQRRIVRQQLV